MKETIVKARLSNDFKWFKENKRVVLLTMMCLFALDMFVFTTLRYLLSILFLSRTIITNQPILIFLMIIYPIAAWLLLTNEEIFHYHNRKKWGFYLIYVNGLLALLQPVYTWVWDHFLVAVFRIQPNESFTESMVILLARVVLVVPLIIAGVIITVLTTPALFSDEAIHKIERFKLKYIIDMRKNKENLYDLRIIRDVKTGTEILFKEIDRFVHMFVLGASGTGKTSSTYSPAIINDLDTKTRNRLKREEALFELCKAGKAYVQGPFRVFSEKNVVPKQEHKKEYTQIYQTYPDCGITIQAPNDAIMMNIIQLCEARSIKVNIVNPMPMDLSAYKNVELKGLNPFFIPLGISEEDRAIFIAEKASIFADVMIAISEKDSKGDSYFLGVNRAVAENIAIVCMLYHNIVGKQSNFLTIQKCIVDFSQLKPMVDKIEDYYNIRIKTMDLKAGKAMTTQDLLSQSEKDTAGDKQAETNVYYQTLCDVKNELLGPGKEEMFKQSKGLKNIVNAMLRHPRIRSVFLKESGIDFDQLFRENEVTIINTALELGETTSTSFGLFFMLSMKDAVQRRPEESRSNHFYWIDEGPQYMHAALESMWALFRQYRCGIIFAVQSLAQFEKTSLTKYLKGVVMGAGIHVVFGRVTAEEMKLYSELSGVREIEEIQKSFSKNSILSDDPTMSVSERTSMKDKKVLEGTELRYRDFQEVTVFYQDEGRIVDARIGKMSFPKKADYAPIVVPKRNWEAFLVKDVKQEEKEIIVPKMVQTQCEQSSFEEEKNGLQQESNKESSKESNKEYGAAYVDKLREDSTITETVILDEEADMMEIIGALLGEGQGQEDAEDEDETDIQALRRQLNQTTRY